MFYLISTLLTGAGLAVGLFLFPQHRDEILIGAALPWANACVGYAFLARGLHASSAKFAVAALGNLGLRLFAMLAAFTLALVLLSLDEIVFILALFFSYLCNSILETIYLQRLKPKTSP